MKMKTTEITIDVLRQVIALSSSCFKVFQALLKCSLRLLGFVRIKPTWDLNEA